MLQSYCFFCKLTRIVQENSVGECQYTDNKPM